MSATGELKTQLSTFIWNISNFNKKCITTGEVITSPIFHLAITANQEHEWYLELHPLGQCKDTQDYLSVFLNVKPAEKDISEKYYFEFSVVDDSGDNVNVRKCSSIDRFSSRNRSWGWKRFIKRDKLLSKKAFLLVQDTLKLSCFISVDPCEDILQNSSISSLGHKYPIDKSIISLVSQYQYLFFFGKYSDFSIKIGDKEIKTHKDILTANSEVFSAMLKHNMKESNTSSITVVDVEYEVMIEFLWFLYCRKQISHANAKSLLLVADKYDVDELKSMCEKILWDDVDIDDACEILCLADLYHCRKLRSNVMYFIITNAKYVVKTKAFEELSTTYPVLLKEICCGLAEDRTELN